jgi:hypothetical protein
MTVPIPLPERVGAKAITCSGPSWVMSWPGRSMRHTPGRSPGVNRASLVWQRTMPLPLSRPARLRTFMPPQVAEPWEVLGAFLRLKRAMRSGTHVARRTDQPISFTVWKIAGA